jgi:cyclic beta-1,2-glucan synthetase
VTVENSGGVSSGVIRVEVDGAAGDPASGIALVDDGKLHRVRVVLGKTA